MQEIFGFDAFSPKEIAERVENVGVVKARLPLLSMFMLGILAGAFIGLGAMCFVLVQSETGLGFVAGRFIGGLVFSLGLILVVIAGAELFTGNNLLVMAWADDKLRFSEVLRNWIVVASANFIGAAGIALLVYFSGHPDMNGGAVGVSYVKIAALKSGVRSACLAATAVANVCCALPLLCVHKPAPSKCVMVLAVVRCLASVKCFLIVNAFGRMCTSALIWRPCRCLI